MTNNPTTNNNKEGADMYCDQDTRCIHNNPPSCIICHNVWYTNRNQEHTVNNEIPAPTIITHQEHTMPIDHHTMSILPATYHKEQPTMPTDDHPTTYTNKERTRMDNERQTINNERKRMNIQYGTFHKATISTTTQAGAWLPVPIGGKGMDKERPSIYMLPHRGATLNYRYLSMSDRGMGTDKQVERFYNEEGAAGPNNKNWGLVSMLDETFPTSTMQGDLTAWLDNDHPFLSPHAAPTDKDDNIIDKLPLSMEKVGWCVSCGAVAGDKQVEPSNKRSAAWADWKKQDDCDHKQEVGCTIEKGHDVGWTTNRTGGAGGRIIDTRGTRSSGMSNEQHLGRQMFKGGGSSMRIGNHAVVRDMVVGERDIMDTVRHPGARVKMDTPTMGASWTSTYHHKHPLYCTDILPVPMPNDVVASSSMTVKKGTPRKMTTRVAVYTISNLEALYMDKHGDARPFTDEHGPLSPMRLLLEGGATSDDLLKHGGTPVILGSGRGSTFGKVVGGGRRKVKDMTPATSAPNRNTSTDKEVAALDKEIAARHKMMMEAARADLDAGGLIG